MLCKFLCTLTAFAAVLTSISGQTVNNVVINEFVAVADSLSPWTDPAGEHEDWVELYNMNATTVNLGGCFLSDNFAVPDKWQMPAGVSIPANGYLIIWCDDDLDQTGLHAPFKLSRDGEELILSRPDLTVLDSVTFGYQENNLSSARLPNGTGNFIITIATFNANNGTSAVIEPDWASEITIFPNPTASGPVQMQLPVGEAQKVRQIRLFSADNRLIRGIGYQLNGDIVQLDLPETAPGMYLIQLQTTEGLISRRILIQ